MRPNGRMDTENPKCKKSSTSIAKSGQARLWGNMRKSECKRSDANMSNPEHAMLCVDGKDSEVTASKTGVKKPIRDRPKDDVVKPTCE